MSGFFPLWPCFAPRRDVVSSHNYRNAGSLQFATTWGNGQEKFWPASSSRSAARGENRVSRFLHSWDHGVRLHSSFLRDNSGPEWDWPIRENSILPRRLARVASAVPQRWSSSCKVSLSFKKVKRRQIIRPSGHTSIARAGGRSKPLASSRHPLRGAIRGYRETCAISDPRTGFLGKILRFVGRGRMPLVRRAPPASIEVAGARPCDPRRPYLRRGRDLS
jgi:hypothetical protein